MRKITVSTSILRFASALSLAAAIGIASPAAGFAANGSDSDHGWQSHSGDHGDHDGEHRDHGEGDDHGDDGHDHAGSVGGIVTSSLGNPLQGVAVQVTDVHGRVLASSVTSAAGTYQIGNLAAGTYSVSFSLTGYVSDTDTAIVIANVNTPVNVILTAVSTGPGR